MGDGAPPTAVAVERLVDELAKDGQEYRGVLRMPHRPLETAGGQAPLARLAPYTSHQPSIMRPSSRAPPPPGDLRRLEPRGR
ncbi:MAG: hypothetical protein ACE5MI_14105, partial [Acidimicrobiia bacterium]